MFFNFVDLLTLTDATFRETIYFARCDLRSDLETQTGLRLIGKSWVICFFHNTYLINYYIYYIYKLKRINYLSSINRLTFNHA